MLKFLNKIFRFFFPKDFYGEMQKGMAIGQARGERSRAERDKRRGK